MCEEEIKELIVNIALNDDRLSFKKIYFYYYNRLLNLAKAIVKNVEAAEEIVDDVFIKLWAKRESLVYVNNLTVYLFVAIKNHSINYNSKHKNIQTTNIDDIDIEIPDFTPGVEETMFSADLAKLINDTIRQLPAQSKLVFKLVKHDGLKYKDVAKILNISPKTVEYHIGSALKIIAQNIAGFIKPYKKTTSKKFLSN